MSYALVKDATVMCRTPSGVVWLPAPGVEPFTWSHRDEAEEHARTQGATVVPVSELRDAAE